MPRMRCPRCSTAVDVAAGAKPVCPACGFGSAAEATAATTPLPTPTAGTGPAKAGRPRVALVAAGVAVLLVAGIAAGAFLLRQPGGHALGEAEARSRVAASLQAASQAMSGTATDSQLRKVENHLTPKPGATPSASPSNPFGSLSAMTMTIEWGTNDAVKMSLHASGGAVTIDYVAMCADRQYLVYGGQAYASRPYADGSNCKPLGQTQGLENDTAPLDELDAATANVVRRSDGTVQATLDENGTHAILEIDAKGRLQSVTADTPEGGWTMTYEYGPRHAIAVPENPKLLPAEVTTMDDYGLQERTLRVTASPQAPPRSDFELRVMSYSSTTPLAKFSLGASGPQQSGNMTFHYVDADGDGKLTAGDSLVLKDSSGSSVPQLVLYDTLADGAVNSNPLGAPGLGLAWLALGLAGLASVLRRRSA